MVHAVLGGCIGCVHSICLGLQRNEQCNLLAALARNDANVVYVKGERAAVDRARRALKGLPIQNLPSLERQTELSWFGNEGEDERAH